MSNSVKDAYNDDAKSANSKDSEGELQKLLNDSAFFEKLVGLAEKLEKYKEQMSPIQLFLFKYIKEFETILLFLRGTRDRDIDVHVGSTEALSKY